MESVGGLLVLLHEDSNRLKGKALNSLHTVVDSHWSEILEQIDPIEELALNDSFEFKELAAAVASKCFYHLEEYNESLQLALRAGKFFDVNSEEEYEVCIIGKCIEAYIALQKQNIDPDSDEAAADDEETLKLQVLAEMKPQIERILNGLFEKCYAKGSFHEALGIGIEAQQLDKIRETIERSGTMQKEMLTHCLSVSQSHIKNKAFRLKVISTLVQLYTKMKDENGSTNYLELAVCLHLLGDVDRLGKLLEELLESQEESYLVALQICFDLMEVQDNSFVRDLLKVIPALEGEEGEADADAPNEARQRLEMIHQILNGKTQAVYLDFLNQFNKTDLLILKNVKSVLTGGRRNSVLHNATIMMHAYMQSGTTIDVFLRKNSKWVEIANNWARFSATGSYGVIHKGNVSSSRNILKKLLPRSDSPGSSSHGPYAEGGALYALGLIHCLDGAYTETGKETLEYLASATHDAQKLQQAMGPGEMQAVGPKAWEPLIHGSCLALGLVAMGSGDVLVKDQNGHDQSLVDLLMGVVDTDDAVTGESAALALGMACLNGGLEYSNIIGRMLAVVSQTKHEKIIRALALGVAMIMYGQEEEAEGVINSLCAEKDSLLRYGGMYTIGLAYAGTANNEAIRRLLRVAVSDVNDDVRRAAVTNLGFVLLNSPERLPELVELLSESYNPHVRYGSAMALGIGCSGMDSATDALKILDALREDKVDFVRQGAMLSTAILLMQKNPQHDDKAKAFRAKLQETFEDSKHSSTMTRMGAILAMGLVDACGRNANIQLVTRSGIVRPQAVAGMALWLQYWYWYPMMHMISLAFSPTALVGLNSDLNIPTGFRVECDAPLAQFDYPEPTTEKKASKQVRVKTAVLSMTAKQQARDKAKGKDDGSMEVDEESSDKKEGNGKNISDEELEKKREEMLSNPLRVTREQMSKIVYMEDQRYQPIANDEQHKSGVVILLDTTPKEEQEVRKIKVPEQSRADDSATSSSGGGAQIPSGFTFNPNSLIP
mmetsp:Transcript_3026/g.4079  ORF Transcript_3026/g.4079 Transcript_3026/m.4079 type:complete len:1004 (+) Transcript_3026:210-3221(+)|eukprot:CAMPEP_0184009610 /NCGR_PEP_ID=MMETSP0954-20121128/2709_1 /TAXON_ID=627963 /ORGANISM="Aplanochytrium sp, Strain PBS07" /LENGTH=1003 /DNA_ID=CAMNT_0026289019 /DNA_START=137 /DNA_END=3148 /DNA_ORIENTATION=-